MIGSVSARDNSFFNGPLGPLALITLLARYAALCFPMLCSLAPFIGSLTHRPAHSLPSLPHGTVEIHEYAFTLETPQREETRFLTFTGNTPNVLDS